MVLDAETTAHVICTFDVRELSGEVTFLSDGSIILHKDAQERISATYNRCRHRNGQFPMEKGCVLTCPNHGWQLDVSKMQYVNPSGLSQQQLLVEVDEDGKGRILEIATTKPWEVDSRPEESLSASEFTVKFYSHACAEIRCGPNTLFTDPWLVGPALSRGWWLAHQPPSDWLDRLAAADAIYISHNHSDHLNLPTLKVLASRNPFVPVFVPQFESDSCLRLAELAGMKNVTVLPFDVWTTLGDESRFMILRDTTGRDDSAILVEYRGHRLLDTVDCVNLNGNVLPTPVDILLTGFAGGGSGYPICWPEQYSDKQIGDVLRKNRDEIVDRVVDKAKQTKAKVVVPFAGYFTEAHPADHEIHSKNVKNTPFVIRDALLEAVPETTTWIPQSGGGYDLGELKPIASPSIVSEDPIHDFDTYLAPIRQDLSFEPLQKLEGIKQYFEWAGFRGPLILHVVETDEAFEEVVREFFVDFSDLSFPTERPIQTHRYLRMRVRADVFRHILRWGFSWEEISSGFQARFYREPDVYNFDFWDHFQNRLPNEGPW
jgi:CMP-N-acetylneuraminate monooxygenase